MSFKSKHDFFNLTTNGSGGSTGLVITDSNENKSATTVQAQNEKGDYVAWEVFAETLSPDCSYAVKASVTLGGIKCGTVIAGTGDYQGKKFTLGSITINTAAGSAPTVSASGEEIPADTTHTDCSYTFPTATLEACHHAQNLWNAFAFTGTGCYLQSANYTAGGTISRATKDGETVAFDVIEGQLTAAITITQTGNTEPTLTAGENWVITAPLTCSNPDANYPTWTATLSRALTHDTPNAGA